jgi:hypothetical protein
VRNNIDERDGRVDPGVIKGVGSINMRLRVGQDSVDWKVVAGDGADCIGKSDGGVSSNILFRVGGLVEVQRVF